MACRTAIHNVILPYILYHTSLHCTAQYVLHRTAQLRLLMHLTRWACRCGRNAIVGKALRSFDLDDNNAVDYDVFR